MLVMVLQRPQRSLAFGHMLSPSLRVGPPSLVGCLGLQLPVAGQSVSVEPAFIRREKNRATGFGGVGAISEPAVAREFLDLGKRMTQPFL